MKCMTSLTFFSNRIESKPQKTIFDTLSIWCNPASLRNPRPVKLNEIDTMSNKQAWSIGPNIDILNHSFCHRKHNQWWHWFAGVVVSLRIFSVDNILHEKVYPQAKHLAYHHHQGLKRSFNIYDIHSLFFVYLEVVMLKISIESNWVLSWFCQNKPKLRENKKTLFVFSSLTWDILLVLHQIRPEGTHWVFETYPFFWSSPSSGWNTTK